MWNEINAIAGCICILLLVYCLFKIRRVNKKLTEVEEELQKRSFNYEIFVDKLRDNFENNVKYTSWAIKDCKERLEEHSKIIETQGFWKEKTLLILEEHSKIIEAQGKEIENLKQEINKT